MKILSRQTSTFVANTEVWIVQPDKIDQAFRLLVTAPHFPAPNAKICGLIALDGRYAELFSLQAESYGLVRGAHDGGHRQ